MSRTDRARRNATGKSDRVASQSLHARKVTEERSRLLIRSLITFGLARGWPQQKTSDEILAKFGVAMSRQNISYISKSILDEAALRMETEPQRLLATQLLRIDQAVEALWGAWENSAGDREITTSRARRTALDGEGKPIGRASDVDDAMTRTERRDPDPRYMTAIARFEELRSRLLGLLREPKEDDDKKPTPPGSIHVHVAGDATFMGAPDARDALSPARAEIVEVPSHAPALAAPAAPGAYR